jgi:putative glutamine amidotransferase
MRIAVTQRVDEVGTHRERRDALDQRWPQLIEALGWVPVPVPNGLKDPQTWARAVGVDALLLSGGNDLTGLPGAHAEAPERDHCETLLLDLAQALQWPVLGVCRGMQMLNRYLGGQLIPVPDHVAVRHVLQRAEPAPRLLTALPQTLEVNSFHGFGIAAAGLARSLVPVMLDGEGRVEAAEHRALPWAAIMWHPERESALVGVDCALLTSLFGPA